jgi:4-methyl-5(b-hydroxyethyl)-thiazole monophosphate biosynthesis
MPKVAVLIADGFEEIEALAAVDILRRAGITVNMMGLTGNLVTSRSGVRLYTDARLIDTDASGYDAIVLPGGAQSVDTIARHQSALRMIEDFAKRGKLVAAICAAPKILAQQGLLRDKRATAYPGLEKLLDRPRNDRVVVDGNIITSQGPGTAIDFALGIVEQLAGKAAAARVRQEIVA